MNRIEKIQYLNQILLEEMPEYQETAAWFPRDEASQRCLLRSLMNVRPPIPASQKFLTVQDALLSEEQEERGVVDVETLPAIAKNPRLVLWQGDITTLKADAIVNAANPALRGCFCPLHSCIDNLIHSRSGIQLRLCCDEIMTAQGYDEPPGQAKITPAFHLPSRYILHTVGPVIHGRVTNKDKELLASCYRSCLTLAAENSLESVAFCCISTGEFHFPNEQAAQIAVETVNRFMNRKTSVKKVIFNVFKDLDKAIYEKLL